MLQISKDACTCHWTISEIACPKLYGCMLSFWRRMISFFSSVRSVWLHAWLLHLYIYLRCHAVKIEHNSRALLRLNFCSSCNQLRLTYHSCNSLSLHTSRYISEDYLCVSVSWSQRSFDINWGLQWLLSYLFCWLLTNSLHLWWWPSFPYSCQCRYAYWSRYCNCRWWPAIRPQTRIQGRNPQHRRLVRIYSEIPTNGTGWSEGACHFSEYVARQVYFLRLIGRTNLRLLIGS